MFAKRLREQSNRPFAEGNAERVRRPHYLETLTLVERLPSSLARCDQGRIRPQEPRRDQLRCRHCCSTILAEKDLTAGELRTRGYYPRLECVPTTSRSSSRWDTSIISARRSIAAQCASGSPTKGARWRDIVDTLYQKQHVPPWAQVGGIDGGRGSRHLTSHCSASSGFWTDQIL